MPPETRGSHPADSLATDPRPLDSESELVLFQAQAVVLPAPRGRVGRAWGSCRPWGWGFGNAPRGQGPGEGEGVEEGRAGPARGFTRGCTVGCSYPGE